MPVLAARLLATITLPALLLTSPGDVRAQSSDWSELMVVDRSTAFRWVHEGRPEWAVPMARWDVPVRLRKRHRPGGEYLSWEVEVGSVSARVSGDTARLSSFSVTPPPISYHGGPGNAEGPGIAERSVRHSRLSRLHDYEGVLRFPLSRVRDLWIPLPSRDLAPGATWTDTLAFVALPGDDLRESYHAIREHTVLSDTLLDGRRVLWIRSEEQVSYEIRELAEPAFSVPVSRRLRGSTVGTVAIDAEHRLRVAGSDTARWEGRAIRHDPVSGELTSEVRFDRVRSWTLFDSLSYESHRDSVRAERGRRGTGMLILPTSDWSERVAAGDRALLDSLVGLTSEPGGFAHIAPVFQALRFAPRDLISPDSTAALQAAAVLLWGDTAVAVSTALEHLASRQLSLEEARFLLPYLDRPELRWRLGLPPHVAYDDLATMLLEGSPLLEDVRIRSPCAPEVCRFFLDRYGVASEPRLRDAVLVGLFARDPPRWHPELLARHEAGSPIVLKAVAYARGEVPGATSSLPFPGPASGVREWGAWWRDLDRRFMVGADLGIAFRLWEATHGVDPLAGLMAEWPPLDDSVRLALEPVVLAAGRIPELTVEELERRVLAGEPTNLPGLSLDGSGGLGRLVRQKGSPVSAEDGEEIVGPLVEWLFAGAGFPWPGLRNPGDPGSGVRALDPEFPPFLSTENVPPSVLERLPPDVSAITGEEWRRRDQRLAAQLYSISEVLRWGPFASLSYDSTWRRERAPDEAPSGFAEGASFLLIHTPQGWRLVSRSSWIT